MMTPDEIRLIDPVQDAEPKIAEPKATAKLEAEQGVQISRPGPLDLAAIERRYNRARKFIGPWTKAWIVGPIEDLPALVQEVKRLTEERDHYEKQLTAVITERDSVEEWADKLAEASGEVGEHSSHNNPWLNGLENIEKLRADNARLREALEKLLHYAWHRKDCPAPERPCTCGLAALTPEGK